MKRSQILNAMVFVTVTTVAAISFGQSPDKVIPLPDTTLVDRYGEVVFQETVSQDFGKYWIGLSCHDAGETLRSHLGISESEGLVVLDAVADGPAAKAGVQKHDVLLRAGDTSLKSLKDLIDAVQKVETKELSLDMIRGGKKMSLKVTPAERPEQIRRVQIAVPNAQQSEAQRQLLELLKKVQTTPDGRVLFVQPGVPLAVAQAAALPNGVSVSITRTNNDPAKITVKRGEESWEITENELDKLPADLRPHVERMLHPVPIAAWTAAQPTLPVAPNAAITARFGPLQNAIRARSFDEAAKKSDVDALRKQVEELSKKLDDLLKATQKQ